MLQHPLLPLTICYVAGVVVAACVPISLAPAFVLAFAVALAAFAVPQGRLFFLAGLLFLAGLVNLASRTAILSPHDLRTVAGAAPTLTTLRGRLVATPGIRMRAGSTPDAQSVRTLALVEAEAIGGSTGWEPVLGRVAVSTPGLLADGFFAGRRVEIFGVLHVPYPPKAPGLFDGRSYFRWLGVYYQFEARDTNDWRLAVGVAQPGGPPLADRFIRWAQRALARGLPEEDDALRLMWAMTLGWRAALTDEVSAPFMRSGTMHVFAISGLHIMLIAGIMVTLLCVCRVPRRVTGLIVVPALWFYTAATGWQPSAVRSTVMMTVVVGGWALQRPGNLLNSLAGAGLILLLWDPRQLFQSGFQLSFFVVLSMALLLPPLERLRSRLLDTDPFLPDSLRPDWLQRRDQVARGVALNLAVSVAAWLGSLPLIAHYFHLVTPVSLLANALIVPLSGLTLTSNLASLVCAAWLPALGELFNHSGWLWMSIMIWTSETSARLPGAYCWVPSPGLGNIALYYLLLVAVAAGWLTHPNRRFRRGAVGVISLLVSISAAQAIRARGLTTVVILPMEGGHSVWIDGPGRGQDLLVDCGSLLSADRWLIPFLHAQGLNQLSHLVLTHGDVRHAGGSACLESNLPPRRISTSHVRSRSPSYRSYLASCGPVGVRHFCMQAGDSIVEWEVLHPGTDDAFPRADDNALVLRRNISGTRVLLLSDLGSGGEEAMLARQRNLRADIVVTGLPAQGQPLSVELLEAIQPQLIVVADDEHPASAQAPAPLRQRLLAAGMPVLFTSEAGAATLRIGRSGWRLESISGGELAGDSSPP